MTTNTANPAPLLIQFPHPGFQYPRSARVKYSLIEGARRNDPSGVMGWKPGRSTHDRKYMVVRGSIMNNPSSEVETDVSVGFWGEWEAPSAWRTIDERIDKYHPSAIHTPLLPADPGASSRQNTDPLVLGGPFRYTNCKMYRRAMQGMPSGSIVLFGRGMRISGEPRFVLDTCFVVDEWESPIEVGPEDHLDFGRDLVDDLVVGPLRTESSSGHARITPYRGRVPGGDDKPFSFFPAVRHMDRPYGFRRPEIRPLGALTGKLTETLMMGLRPTTLDGPGHAEEVWHEVVEQVLAQGCELGVQAEAPAPGSLDAALEVPR